MLQQLSSIPDTSFKQEVLRALDSAIADIDSSLQAINEVGGGSARLLAFSNILTAFKEGTQLKAGSVHREGLRDYHGRVSKISTVEYMRRTVVHTFFVELQKNLLEIETLSLQNPLQMDPSDAIIIQSTLANLNNILIGDVDAPKLPSADDLVPLIEGAPNFGNLKIAADEFRTQFNGDKTTCFVSYSRHDKRLAWLIADYLTSAGITIIIDKLDGPSANNDISALMEKILMTDFVVIIGTISYGTKCRVYTSSGVKQELPLVMTRYQQTFPGQPNSVIRVVANGNSMQSLPPLLNHQMSLYVDMRDPKEFAKGAVSLLETLYWRFCKEASTPVAASGLTPTQKKEFVQLKKQQFAA